MRIALGQINPTLGAFEANRRKIAEYVQRAYERRCELVVLPEHALFGYLPNDLLERPSVVKEQLKQLSLLTKEIPKGISVLVGCVSIASARGRHGLSEKWLYNSAALLERGTKTRFFHKQKLPTYDVFDEARHCRPGLLSKNLVRIHGRKVLVTICEDIWGWEDGDNPLRRIPKNKVDLVINLSASPFTTTKRPRRLNVIGKTAKYFSAPMVYVNMVGAQDEVLFDGRSMVVDKRGKVLSELAAFDEDLGVFDVSTGETGRRTQPEKIELLRRALVCGIRDFVKKTGMERVHLGLSGGIDSAVVACLAADAIGPSNVTLVTLPSQFNDPRSRTAAERLAKSLGARCVNLNIEASYQTLVQTLEDTFGSMTFGLTHENLQSRIRGVLLMALSNRENSLLLNTSNKVEMAAGYSTLYGDQCGGLSPIGDLVKAEIYELARYYNREVELIPSWIIDRPPSAELRPNQKDQDSLPPYEILDAAVESIIEKRNPAKTDVEQWLLRASYRSEFKRWQAPPVIKVKEHSFGRGRRMPIAHQAKL